jgi:hypothetical protein
VRRRVTGVLLALAVAARCCRSRARAAEPGGGERGTGIGSRAALAGPHCDPDTGRVAVPTSLVLPCVRPFGDGQDNGGASAPGVTATTIEVLVILPSEEQTAAFRTRGQALPHAFGLGGQLPPVVRDASGPNFGVFGWYWGQTEGTITPIPGPGPTCT